MIPQTEDYSLKFEKAAGNDCQKLKKKKISQQRTKQEKFREHAVEIEMTFQRMSNFPKEISWVLLGHFHKIQSARIHFGNNDKTSECREFKAQELFKTHCSKEFHYSKYISQSKTNNFLKIIA